MWNQFEPTFSEDETLGSEFFTNSLLKISNEQKSTKNPTVLSSYQNNTIIISVDSSLIILEDEVTDNCKFLSFGAEINCFVISQSGKYMVCCLNDGNIHAIHSKGYPLFNLSIQPEDINESISFVDIQTVNDEFFILCFNGRVYRLQGINENELVGIDTETDSTLLNTSIIATNIKRIDSPIILSKINSFCVVKQSRKEFIIICCNDGVIFIEDNQRIKIKYPKDIDIIIKIYNLDYCIVGFTYEGYCVEICPFTKIIRKIEMTEEDLQKFSMMADMKILETNNDVELLTLSISMNNEHKMRVIDFPSFSCKNEINLPDPSWIVLQPKSAINMYFIVGSKNEENYVQSIELKNITEADPEERFQKLLQKGHYDEAESYAKNLGLSLEPLYQARVKKLLIEISLEKKSEEIEKKFEILLKQMNLIENKDFMVSLSFSNDIPDRTCLTRFLEYIQQNIDTNKYSEENDEINECLLRLETLRLIDPYDTNLEFRKFLRQKDMMKAAIDYFRTDVLLSCLIWSRHASSIMPNMNLQQFYTWLNEIRSNVEPFHLIQWLKHFTPCFLQVYPKETSKLVEWCINRTHSLQFSPKWPEIALEFITNIKSIFNDLEFLFIDVRRSFHSNMEKIQKLINVLEEMVVLKKRYHLSMSLKDYQEDSFEETAFKLLQRIQIHNIKNMVNDFLYPVFLEHGSLPEETIVKYINFLATNKNFGYWQERAIICTELLNNEENRLRSALLILKVSPVPWSPIVLPLAELGTKSNHPIANLIFIEYKNQAIKILKLKYGWPVDYFDLQQDRIKLVLRILKVNNPDMIEDIKILVKSSPDISSDAYVFLIHKLIESGRMDEFIKLIANLEDETECKHALLEKTVNIFVKEIENEPLETNQIKNYIEAMKFLLNQQRDTMDEFKFEYTQNKIKSIKNLVKLRELFNFDITLKDLNNKQNKLKWYVAGIEKVAKEVRLKMSIDDIWSKLNLLANAFDGNRILIYFMLCRKLNNVFITCKIIDGICQLDEAIDKDQIEFAFRFCAFLVSQQIIDLENNRYHLKQCYDPLAFPLAFEFLKKCLVNYNLLYHNQILKFLHWIGVIRSFYSPNVIETTRSQRVINQIVFSSTITNANSKEESTRRQSLSVFEDFEEKLVPQPTQNQDYLTPVLQCVCNAIKMIALTTDPENAPFSFIKTYLDSDSSAQELKDAFFSSLENILKLKLSMESFIIMQLISDYQMKGNHILLPQSFVSSVNRKILKFMLSQKDPEYFNAFVIFRSENSKIECLEYLKSSLKNNSQRIAFSTFSEMYNKYKNNNDFNIDRESRLKLYYYSELCKYYPNMRTSTNLDTVGISDFLKGLENHQLPVELLRKLSKDFGWNYQKSLIKQVKQLLRKQELEYEIKMDAFGKAEIVVKTSVEAIKRMCNAYLTEITDTNFLGTELEKFFSEINDYFYELFLVVIDFMEFFKEIPPQYKLYKNILLLLKHKLTMKRRSIGAEEHENWMTRHSVDNTILPAISTWRLPFSMIINMDPEISISKDLIVETFETYYPLMQLHSALKPTTKINERIEICALAAATNSVQDMRTQAEATVGAQWNLKPRNNAFLQAVIRMIGYLNDKGKALAILYFIVTNTPQGCDQMEASFECWKFALAQEHNNDVKSKYAEVVNKIKRKYPLLKTQHMLHLYGLADDRLMKVIDDPVLLINSLYEHESILQPQKKEINKLCKEIASLYNIDLMALQVKILKNLLSFAETSSSNECGNVNETVYEDFLGGNASNSEHIKVTDENVIRAYYILGSWSSENSLEFIASELSSDRVHAENQLQLFECFAKLVDEDNFSYMELVKTENYLLVRVCHFLKALGLNYKPQTFKDCDKVDLLKRIWTNHHNNIKALEVMSLICLGFDINLPQIWNGILKKMVNNKMITQVSVLVEILSTRTKFLHLNGLKLAWEFVIKEPLLQATNVQNFEEDQKLAKALILLQKCPISTLLNLESFTSKCIQLNRPHMGAIFLAFAKDNDRKKMIDMFENYDKHELKIKIEELEIHGIAPVITKSVINTLNL
ncbi:hypothetical protein PVAND_008204 [Polypedilum vanderplanki]|uniref:RZZ complex subunit KNTC1/ROD C-terminal domain-containing protein n=1 Tax=Polypedilum vanderplanki TaxID=319348 RepID=A0A9J6C8Y4_POLVA|nr:hypothetical protein PVAND_008204 [Polypedilum vanderplanki]